MIVNLAKDIERIFEENVVGLIKCLTKREY